MAVTTKYKIPTLTEWMRTTTGKDNWQTKKPVEKWSYLFKLGRMVGDISGILAFADDQKFQYLVCIVYFEASILAALTVYTICFHIIRGDLRNAFPATSIPVGPLLCVSLLI